MRHAPHLGFQFQLGAYDFPQPAEVRGRIVQASGGISRARARQLGVQRAAAGSKDVDQVQMDPRVCCATQNGNPKNRVRIVQDLDQFATASSVLRVAKLEGHCDTSEDCAIRQRLNQDGVITRTGGAGAHVEVRIEKCGPPDFCGGPPF